MEAFDKIKQLIEEKKSFVLEAGAGSGKTYTLIQTINYLLENKGTDLKLKNQKIVCITYTNVAKNEIIERLENNPLVIVSTIHEFLWDCIKSYNKQLLIEFDALNTAFYEQKPEKYQLGLIERITKVEYDDRVYSEFEEGKVGHDDLITLSRNMFKNYELLTNILSAKYPYILIDEYQDTAIETVESLIEYLFEKNKGKVILGFFGDSYQKIYDTGVGSLSTYIESNKIELVTKEENYRCSQSVVNLLNNVRTNIVQKIPENIEVNQGSIKFINCKNYPVLPPKGKITEYEKSLIPQKNSNYDQLIMELESDGWNFGKDSDDKILIIANSRVAERGGFGDLYKIYSTRYGQGANEALLKRENYFTSFFIGSIDKKTSKERETGIEHLVAYYLNKEYNSVMRFLKKNGKESFNLKTHKDKSVIADKIKELVHLRKTKNVKAVFDFSLNNKLVSLPLGIKKFQERIQSNTDGLDEEIKKKIEKDINFYNNLMALPYSEFIELFKHSQNQSVFSTKHGTKGEEYRNVLVVIDDTSWKQKYNFQDFINGSEKTPDRELRTKNLFYVSCSRAKEKLVVLSLSNMEDTTMNKVKEWFGKENVVELN